LQEGKNAVSRLLQVCRKEKTLFLGCCKLQEAKNSVFGLLQTCRKLSYKVFGFRERAGSFRTKFLASANLQEAIVQSFWAVANLQEAIYSVFE